MAVVKFLRKLTSEIEELPVVDGQLIFNTENGAQYMDYGNQRLPIGINNLPLATNTSAGLVIPDSATLEIDDNGTLSVNIANIGCKNAYELAVDEGFSGTLSDWLASLKGAKGDKGTKGDKGEQGTKGENGDTGAQGVSGEDGLDGADGIDGKSAYETAVEGGYLGSESEFVQQLSAIGSPLPTATASDKGIVKPDNDTITVTNGVIKAKQYSLPAASASSLGGVKIGNNLKLTGGSELTTDIQSIALELHRGEFLFTISNELIINKYGYDRLFGECIYLKFKQVLPYQQNEYIINNFNPNRSASVSYTFAVDGESFRTVTIARNDDGGIKITSDSGNMSLTEMYILYSIKFNINVSNNILISD